MAPRPVLADSSYSLSLKMVNEDANNQSAFTIVSPLTGKQTSVLDKTITVNQLPDSATTYQDVFDEYAKENPTDTGNGTLQEDIPTHLVAFSNYLNGIWNTNDIFDMAYIKGVSQQPLADGAANFTSAWTDASGVASYTGPAKFTLDQAGFKQLLAQKIARTTTSQTLEIPFKATTTAMQVHFQTSDGAALPSFADSPLQAPMTDKTITGYVGQTVDDEMFIPKLTGYTADKTSVTFTGTTDQRATVTYIADADLMTTTIHYQYADGTTAAADKVIYGYHTAQGQEPSSTVTSPTITGYTASQTSVPVAFDGTAKRQEITVTYTKTAENSAPTGSATSSTTTGSSVSGDAAASSGSAAKVSSPVSVTRKVILARRQIARYRTPTFSRATRQVVYEKQPRAQRPEFLVLGYARSKQGRLRYHVRDITPHSRTKGQTGYVTTKAAYVTAAYYQTQPRRIKVLARGLNGYRTRALTHRRHHYRAGQILRVKKLVHDHLTTRLLLTNGDYVSANKRLIIQVTEG
ncbi:MAG: DUF5776 domain-containing protein [Levilactobacillus sp.]|uniref:DUF5776 domain-containing protein n=1 Tax=Levilactobacillus sp. TaxID=2767919 RepID=UPI002585B5EC|nr:DUF5776 domain-containing protein [Levilactobacillus sp.]MCH4123107.1 DUF5776 domain-containing protein [Levilactobacillus sp.]MCI1552755.1 DUF5776 domain-containing protein [Levilactobacillus sp.]MCI1606730.1 DUF5776 domain-containing protein [Levilactobacillus sp.]